LSRWWRNGPIPELPVTVIFKSPYCRNVPPRMQMPGGHKNYQHNGRLFSLEKEVTVSVVVARGLSRDKDM
jgi:hypothetical protein